MSGQRHVAVGIAAVLLAFFGTAAVAGPTSPLPLFVGGPVLVVFGLHLALRTRRAWHEYAEEADTHAAGLATADTTEPGYDVATWRMLAHEARIEGTGTVVLVCLLFSVPLALLAGGPAAASAAGLVLAGAVLYYAWRAVRTVTRLGVDPRPWLRNRP